MKILVLTTSFPLNKNDLSGKAIFLQAQGLVKKGFDVHVLAPHHRGVPKQEIMNSVKISRFQYGPEKLEVVSYGAGLGDNLRDSFGAKVMFPFFLIAFLFSAVIKSRNYDLLHANYSVIPGFIGSICKLLYRKPLIVTVRGGDLEYGSLFFLINKFVFSIADYIIGVNSEYIRRAIYFGAKKEKTDVIYSEVAINKNLLELPIKEQFQGNLLFISRLVPVKNLLLVLKALKSLRNKGQFKLVVVGDGTERAQLEQFSQDNSLTDIVTFEGKKGANEIAEFLSKADVFVLPQKAEGVGVSLLEAMAAGVPAISGKVKGIEDVATHQHTGILVSTEDPRELESAILELAKNKSLRFKIAQNARNLIKERYLSQGQLDRVVQVYNKLLKAPN